MNIQPAISAGVIRGMFLVTPFGGQNYELSDRCFCCLRVASRPFLHRALTTHPRIYP